MRTRNLLTALMAALILVPAATAQPGDKPEKQNPPAKPKPAPDSLEATIEDALRHNPDIQAAAAKVREAQIHLNKIRNEVMVSVAAQHKLFMVAKEGLQSAEQLYKLKEQLAAAGKISNLEMIQAKAALNQARAMIAESEAALMKLVGRVPGQPPVGKGNTNLSTMNLTFSPDGRWIFGADGTWVDGGQLVPGWSYTNDPMGFRGWNTHGNLATVPFEGNRPATPDTSITDKLREAMKQNVKLERRFANATVAEVLQELKERGLKDIPVRMLTRSNDVFETTLIDLLPGELPLSAWFTMVQDSVPTLRFLVREYGLLITTTDRAPPDALRLSDFLRQPQAPKKEDKSK